MNIHERRSILVVVERGGQLHQSLAKALLLARHFGASLELFLCDAEHAYALQRLYDARGADEARAQCMAEGVRFLEALRQSVAPDHVQISVDVACKSPMYEGIVRKVLASCPELVIKELVGPNGSRRGAPSDSDWQLVRTCPVPLMLTRARPWHRQPRFAAAVDVSPTETEGLARSVARTTARLAEACGAIPSLLYARNDAPAPAESSVRALRTLAEELGIGEERVHLVDGPAAQVLPEFAARQGYDLIVLGALTHRKSPVGLVGTLTGRLLDTLDCDFVVVKPGTYVSPVARAATPADRADA